MTTQPWDRGIRYTDVVTVSPTALPLSVAYVRDEVLRVANGSVEDTHIERLIEAATAQAEEETGLALMPQTRRMTLTGFAGDRIVLPRAPLIAVTALSYIDTAGATQTLTGSPAEYRVKPSSRWSRAEVWPLENTQWPSTASVPSAVVIDYECGYALDEAFSPPEVTIPFDILQGIELMVAELYKQRSLSVHAVHNTASVLDLRRFWKHITGGLP